VIRYVAILLASAVVLGLGAPTSLGARAPSERRCLLAWNSPDNAASRQRIVAEGPWPQASLFAGVSGTITWRRGAKPVTTNGPACLLTLVRRKRVQPVTGLWRNGVVRRWWFERPLTANRAPGPTNVKVLTDGRVTKVYLR
jgi:hypothetical protein